VSELFIVDAHAHTGYPAVFFSPEVDAKSLLRRMDRLLIRYTINLCSMRSMLGPLLGELEAAQREHEESGGRIFYCAYCDPRRTKEDLGVMGKAARWSGFKGIKIHPSFAKIPADDDRYAAVWEFAADHGLPIVAHTWSVSSYNPVQVLSTPEKFERFIRKYPGVKFVLGHSGGRGEGRREALRMACEHENVYMDTSGDVSDRHRFEAAEAAKVAHKVLFGSDYPWIDHRSHLAAVYLADITTDSKRKILRDTALAVYRLEG